MLYAMVNRKEAQSLKEKLKRLHILADGYPVIREDDLIGFPILNKPKEMDPNVTIREINAEQLPQRKPLHELISRSFDLIGSIAVVRVRREVDLSGAAEEAKILMQLNPSVQGVFARVGPVGGQYRTSPLVHLAGSRETLTVHRENGFAYVVDVEKVFFSPRLATERRRIYLQVRPGERVLDMFAGVGPFSIPMAKRGATVWSCEINPTALQLLEKNAALNRAYVRTFPGDARAVAEGRARGWAQRIIMNLPSSSIDFMDSALLALSASGGIIHVYVRAKDNPAHVLSSFGRITFMKPLKEVSSTEKVYVADLLVT